MLITFLAILFISYELIKMKEASRSMIILGEINEMNSLDTQSEKEAIAGKIALRPVYLCVFLIEIVYVLFCISLLFTKFWLVGAGIIALVGIKELARRINISKNAVWFSDSIATIVLLGIILYVGQ